MVTAITVKEKIQGLIDKSNNTTGNSDTTLTDAVDALVGGYGVDSAPVTEPITITENGVYPVPKGGSLEFGKEAQFKSVIGINDVTAYMNGNIIGEVTQVEQDGMTMKSYAIANAFDSTANPSFRSAFLMVQSPTGSSSAEDVIYFIGIMVSTTLVWGYKKNGGATFIEPDTNAFASLMENDNVWYEINVSTMQATPLNEAPAITIPADAVMNADLATTAIFFDIDTHNLDGWGDITVDVKATPVVEPITITENGVYPVPKSEGLEYGKEYTFKSVITREDCEKYIANAEPHVTNSDSGENWYCIYSDTSEGTGEYIVMLVHQYLEDTFVIYYNESEKICVIDAGWVSVNISTGTPVTEPTDPPTIPLTDGGLMSADLATTAVFFDVETKSLDGWGDITVDVGGGIIDVETLPTEDIDENAVYRVLGKPIIKFWIVTPEAKAEFADNFKADSGLEINLPTYVVTELPEVMEPMNMSAPPFTFPVYVLESTGYGYISFDGTNSSENVAPLSQIAGVPDKGWVDNIENITPSEDTAGIYTVHDGESYPTLYTYSEGEWATFMDSNEYEEMVSDYEAEIDAREFKLARINFDDYAVLDEAKTTWVGVSEQGVEARCYEVPNTITAIGDGALKPVKNLKHVSFEENSTLSNIGAEAFTFCTSLTNIELPDSITSIGTKAFSVCLGLTEMTIPNKVTSIGEGAFWDCDNLVSVNIPDTMTSISNRTFQSCDSLTNITIGNNITSIGDYAFYNCGNLTNITIPDGVTSIGTDAFHNCSNLTSFTIPNSVTTIGGQAFQNCSNLTSITIGNGVTNFGYKAFLDCTGLKAVYITDMAAWCSVSRTSTEANPLYYAHNLYLNDELVTELTIPNSVTSIGRSALSYCTSLTNVIIPNSVTSVADYAFNDCTNLINATIGNNVTSIGSSAFCNCSNLTSVTIGNKVTEIHSDAFKDCINLNAVYITDIAAWCDIWFQSRAANPLYHAHNLYLNGELVTELVIPGSVYSTGDSVFEGCNSLTSVDIRDGVKYISQYTFRNCENLTHITIPASTTSIGGNALTGCSALVDITYLGTKEQWNAISITDSWNTNTGEYTIHCTDGDITKDGTET